MAGEITIAEVQARIPADMWLRVFDRDGTGTADVAYAQQCIDDAISEAEMRLEASLPGYLAAKSAAVANAIKRRIAVMSLYNGVQFNASTAGQTDKDPAPYATLYKQACDFFDRLAHDDRNRPTDGTVAQPLPVVDNVTQTDGVTPNSPWNRAASGQDPSAF